MGNRASLPWFPPDSDHPQVSSIAISGFLGIGAPPPSKFPDIVHPSHLPCISAINIALAFCMGTDIEYRGTLALWSFVVAAQYVYSSIPCMSLLITFPLGT